MVPDVTAAQEGCAVAEQRRLVRLGRLSQATKEARAAYDLAREARDREIDLADAEGFGTREIARACDIAPGTVINALAREAAGR